jgi:hypothetical protein
MIQIKRRRCLRSQNGSVMKLFQNPGRQADRRVGQAVGKSLRSRCLNLSIGGEIGAPRPIVFKPSYLLGRQRVGDIVGSAQSRYIQMDGGKVRCSTKPHPGGDVTAPISGLGYIMSVSEHIRHQSRPHSGNIRGPITRSGASENP